VQRCAAPLSPGKGPAARQAFDRGVPISLREPGDTRQNNQVSGMLCQIATDIADPAERLDAIVKSSSQAKQLAGTFRDAVPQDSPSSARPSCCSSSCWSMAAAASPIAADAMNVTISNVPGRRCRSTAPAPR